MEKAMKKYPWNPCVKCRSKSSPHYKDPQMQCGHHSYCISCQLAQPKSLTLALGSPALTHRHRCETCERIFECQPCPHHPNYLPTESIPRICPGCVEQERKAS